MSTPPSASSQQSPAEHAHASGKPSVRRQPLAEPQPVAEPLLEVRDLRVAFPVLGGVLRHKVAEVRAVDGVSFTLYKGETLGLVGESGCGKTTVSKSVINILRETSPGVHVTGQILFHGRHGTVDLLSLGKSSMRRHRGDIQMIFQDPFSSLNPRMTVEQIIEGPMRLHTNKTAGERREEVAFLLQRVGLQPAHATRYPHEFSGGQRQRIGIARALSVRPQLVIADEPVSALDVSVRSQVINLLQELQDEFKLTYLFVAHDLAVVRHISARIAVMYLGNIIEVGTSDTVCNHPVHPYTKALLSAVPEPDPARKRASRIKLQGEIPTPLNKPSGCGFRTRCPIARPECALAPPPLLPKPSGQLAACPYSE